MPLYEYQCPIHEGIVDVRHGMNEKPQVYCEQPVDCDCCAAGEHLCAEPLERYYGGAVAIAFKGSGFYVNDSKSPKVREVSRKQAEARRPDRLPNVEPVKGAGL